MEAKTKQTIGTFLLFIAAVVSLVFALLLAFYPEFGPRTVLLSQSLNEPQTLLVATISLFGVLSAGFIAAIALLYVNRQTQTYSWRRDQALKDIERIFEPLYQDTGKVTEATESLTDLPSQSANWNTIISSYLGTILNLRSKEIYQESKDLFNKVRLYGDRRWDALLTIRQIAKSVVERYLDTNLPTDAKDLILGDMPVSLDYETYVYQGFLVGKSVRDWSSLKFRGDNEYLIRHSFQNIKGKGYWQHQEFTNEQVELMLNEIYEQAQNDPKIKRFRDWCIVLNSEAVQLKVKLEKRIIEPQLP